MLVYHKSEDPFEKKSKYSGNKIWWSMSTTIITTLTAYLLHLYFHTIHLNHLKCKPNMKHLCYYKKILEKHSLRKNRLYISYSLCKHFLQIPPAYMTASFDISVNQNVWLCQKSKPVLLLWYDSRLCWKCLPPTRAQITAKLRWIL